MADFLNVRKNGPMDTTPDMNHVTLDPEVDPSIYVDPVIAAMKEALKMNASGG